MAKTNVPQWSATANSNSDLNSLNVTGTGLISTADDSFRELMSQVAKFYADLGGVNTVAGTGDVITVTTAEVFTALATGLVLTLKASATNTTNVTINVDGLGAKAIRKFTTAEAALVAGDLVAGMRYLLVYDATANSAAGAWIVLNGALAGVKGFGPHNRLFNGNGAINQRGATAPTNDTYAWDRHNVLTQTAAIGVSTLSNVQNGLPSMMRMTQSQVTAQRMGNTQIIESVNCIGLRGQTVTLVGKLRNSLAAAVRYAVLEWTGTADVVTSDVVNSWTNGTFTAGQFFKSTTTNVLAVGAITPSAAAVTDFLLTATVGSSATNLIVMIWTETAQAQNSTLDVAWELLDYDATGRTYPTEFRPYGHELGLCRRYYMTYGGNNAFELIGLGFVATTSIAEVFFNFAAPMFAAPTIAVSAVGNWVIQYSGSSSVVTAVSINTATPDVAAVYVTVTGTPLTVSGAAMMGANNTTAARLNFTAEL